MSVLDQERVDKIKQLLKWNPRGMTISDLSSHIDMNRNLVSKYLDMLLISGQVEMSMIGPAKVYFLSHRVPISALLEFSSELVIVLDSGQRILKVNEPVLALLGQTRDAIVGTDMGETRDPFLSVLAGYLPSQGSGEIAYPVVEFCCLMKEGNRHFRMKQIPTAFEDGGQGITLIVEDITASVSYQENLRMSEARYRGIVEDQTEFIVRFLPDGNATFVNDAYARYLGSPVQDLVGQSFLPYIVRDDTHVRDQAISSLSRDVPLATFECRIRHPCGHDRWNTWTIRAIFDDSGTLSEYQGVGRDNTGKREAAAKINRYIRSMEFLAQTSMAFRDMGEEDDIFEFVASRVYSLAPGFLVWVGFLDESTRTLVLKGVVGNPIALVTMENFIGMRVMDMTFPINVAETAELIRHRKLVKAPALFELLHMQVPEEICRRIEKEAGGIDSYLMGLVSKGRIVGDVGISMPSGSELQNRDLIEAFIRQAAIAIDRKIADDELRRSLAREREQVRNLEFLSRTAMDFIDMDGSADIYQYIADQLLELIPESIVGVNSFDQESREIILRVVAGDRELIKQFWSIIGADPVGMRFPIEEEPLAELELSKQTMFEAPPLYNIFFRQFPEECCIRATESLKLGKAYAIGISYRGDILGDVLIQLTRPGGIANREIVEAFVHQASVALLRRFKR
jgi:PAS domain S-box-containing protein